ncbi:MAG: D-alanyl-D-alanine carboxypeptidase family protein [Clostridia bacterium]|nr:D-alanyl-D-alanine carboxypeptidase family protein [Clostridia bacterium]
MRTCLALIMCLMAWGGMQWGTGLKADGERCVVAGNGDYIVYAGLNGGDREVVRVENLPKANDFLQLVNEKYPGTIETEMTTSVRSMVGSFLPVEEDFALRPEVIYALCDMALDQPLHEEVILIRGYVSPQEQDAWQREAAERYQKVGKSREEALRKVPSAGCSDHQSGLAVDIRLSGVLQMGQKQPLQRSETGKWLQENMWRYGFVQDREGACEEIHLRYVGRQHARMMKMLDMGLEGYLALLNAQGELSLEKDGRVLVYVKMLKGEGEVAIPDGMPVELSGDGRGNVVLCGWTE